jgi:hypothetical protein
MVDATAAGVGDLTTEDLIGYQPQQQQCSDHLKAP